MNPILCVDDEPQNLAALRQVLGDKFPLAFANSGEAAIKVARAVRPSLVLLDIRMPDFDGYHVCRALKKDPATADTPVIFVTSLSEEVDEASGFAAGAVDYITKPLSPLTVEARVNTHLSLVKSSSLKKAAHDAIAMLGAAGHYKDTDTGLHIWRMAAYARAIAKGLGWNKDQCDDLESAAPMHDTGKIGIPDHVLCKPGKLDVAEWEIMRTHTTIGHEILSQSDSPVFLLAAEIALYHHEKWDGSGYPYGLVGEEIPLSARIVSIADVFDALTMRRPYKEAWDIDRALATIRKDAGSHFDPQLVDLFIEILPEILSIKSQWDRRVSSEEESDESSMVNSVA